MTDTITLHRSVVEQALDAMNLAYEGKCRLDTIPNATDALRAALEQPQVEQEPVAWIENIGGGVSYNPYHEAARKLPDGVRFDLYTHPQPKHQPLTDDERQDVYAKAIKAINNDPHLPWRDAIVFETERAHGIGGEK